MQKFFCWVVLTGLVVACSPKSSIVKELHKTEIKFNDHTGFLLYDPLKKKNLVEFNSKKYFTPASNTKIFTFYTALKLLGDSLCAFKYSARNDSLVIWGMGDPSFLNPDVFQNDNAFRFLKNSPGRLFISTAHFQGDALGAGWAWDDYTYSYSPERSSFPIYGSLVSIKKNAAQSFKTIPTFFSKLIQPTTEWKEEESLIRSFDSNVLRYYPGKKRNTSWMVPIHFTPAFTTELLSDTLKREVEVLNHSVLASAKKFYSIPLDSALKVMMVDSDNHIAEQLLLQCASVVSDTLHSEIAIRYATKNLFADSPDKLQWVDGSGLSRFNLFTPRTIVHLWDKIYFTIPQDRLFSLLAVGGKSGTIKNWYKEKTPYIYAKTGTLSNNHCLSGFLITKRGKTLIFSMMSNNFVASSYEVRKQMEKIFKMVYEKY
jgi:serine-type D-Ala-D-Ala carboxypeptidase/endopeptidase (penicillin-binding protein 4)